MSLSYTERLTMGQNGRDYILRNFASEKIAKEMLLLYQWLLGEVEKPDFIYEH